MKKIISVILTLALTLSVATFAQADQSIATFTADTVNGNVGDTVTVFININAQLPNNEMINSISMEIRYDPAAVRLVRLAQQDNQMVSDFFDNNGSAPLSNIPEPGVFIIAWAHSSGTNRSGVLFGLEFEILSNTGSPVTLNNLRFSVVNSSSGAQSSYSSDPIILGGVSVGSNPPPTPKEENLVDDMPQVSTDPIYNQTLAPQNDFTSIPYNTDDATDPNQTLTPGEATPEQGGSLQGDNTGTPSIAPDDGSSGDAADGEGGGGSRVWIYILGGLGVLLIIGAAVMFVKQKKKEQ